MALGTLSGFTPHLLTTTAATLISAVPGNYVAARLTAGAAAAKLRIYNHNAATPVAAQCVSILTASAANLADETGVPIRCDRGVVVKLSVNSATAVIYVR